MSKELSLSLLEIEKNLKDFVFELEMGKVDEMFINNSFEIIEKSLKALEIIKEKEVNVGLLSRCANAERYNKGICYELRYLTQEEYDLLKEVLL